MAPNNLLPACQHPVQGLSQCEWLPFVPRLTAPAFGVLRDCTAKPRHHGTNQRFSKYGSFMTIVLAFLV